MHLPFFRSKKKRAELPGHHRKADLEVADVRVEFPIDHDAHFPQSFDPDFYKSQTKDVSEEIDPLAHFENVGRRAGLPGSAGCSKRWIVEKIRRMQVNSILEIGPGCNPIISGEGVFYFDVKSREQLIERYRNTEQIENVPSEIHYVQPNGDLTPISMKFDVVISSHVIEHTTDLIDHFQSVYALLYDGGYYVLFVPDKRFCFDHFKDETQFEEVITQHYVGDSGWSRFLKCYLLEKNRRAHNVAQRHWGGDHGKIEVDKGILDDAIKSARSVFENPIDRFGYHNWFFSDISFEYIVTQLAKTGKIDLKPYAIYNTVRNTFEFCAVLKKPCTT